MSTTNQEEKREGLQHDFAHAKSMRNTSLMQLIIEQAEAYEYEDLVELFTKQRDTV